MSSLRKIALGEIMASRLGSVDPSKFPQEIFDLYSIPAFDSGKPEVVEGSAIGSAKQIVQPGDVLLSKIVPHIRRTWIVGEYSGRRLIASGEWIVFRSKEAHPEYLRHVLVSDHFHMQFMSTVSGVGGSLLRARPAQVATIEVPFPPLPEQRRIAAILDKADAVRRKRQEAIRLTEEFLRSVFLDMFGDPVTNPKGWKAYPLGEVCDFSAGNSLPVGEPYEGQIGGHLLLKVGDMNLPGNETFISHGREWRGSFRGNNVSPVGSVILPKRGGAISTNKKRMLTRTALLDPNLMGVYPLDEKINSYYLFQWFQGFDLTQLSSGSAVPQLNKKDLTPLKISVPPLTDQKKFEDIFRKTYEIKGRYAADIFSDLFNTSVQLAFRGEL